MGFGPRQTSPGEEGRVGVIDLVHFFQTYTGLDRPPSALTEWLRIPEQNLSLCTNGTVFFDPLGEFSSRREHLLRFYPEDVRRKKIASRCLTAGQSGQYNVPRSLKRRDMFAFQYGVMKYCTDIISLVYLLNRTYTPYFKWMHRGVKDLVLLGASTYQAVETLTGDGDPQLKADRIETFSQEVIGVLKEEGLTDSQSDFLLDHASSVHAGIQDRQLGERLHVVG
jgi:hypothetical protein